jgi:hypothetical protein
MIHDRRAELINDVTARLRNNLAVPPDRYLRY